MPRKTRAAAAASAGAPTSPPETEAEAEAVPATAATSASQAEASTSGTPSVTPHDTEVAGAGGVAEESVPAPGSSSSSSSSSNMAAASSYRPAPPSATTMEERKSRMAALRKKMAQSSSANRKDLLLDKQPRSNNRKDASNSRKIAKAEQVLDERDARERGEDWERIRNIQYSIEDEERWRDMQERKEQSQDQGIMNPNSLGARSYARVVRNFKPDVNAYKQQQQQQQQQRGGEQQGGSTSNTVAIRSQQQQLCPPNSELTYGAHKPNDDAIDRVVSHLNMEEDVRNKRSRKRAPDETADVTYINEKNAAYNRKINRHFDEHTREIRENFERGTAL